MEVVKTNMALARQQQWKEEKRRELRREEGGGDVDSGCFSGENRSDIPALGQSENHNHMNPRYAHSGGNKPKEIYLEYIFHNYSTCSAHLISSSGGFTSC